MGLGKFLKSFRTRHVTRGEDVSPEDALQDGSAWEQDPIAKQRGGNRQHMLPCLDYPPNPQAIRFVIWIDLDALSDDLWDNVESCHRPITKSFFQQDIIRDFHRSDTFVRPLTPDESVPVMENFILIDCCTDDRPKGSGTYDIPVYNFILEEKDGCFKFHALTTISMAVLFAIRSQTDRYLWLEPDPTPLEYMDVRTAKQVWLGQIEWMHDIHRWGHDINFTREDGVWADVISFASAGR
ncbi:uncharacterized protein N7459_005324 [Penicillium hispanicum]|uniref:uncharacterized protein n=1 Tax=Penicillium hispanicum TaxID=1080232 RepID=UPI0025412CE6|nr:uncharacterized protein N7459_005324 [Penicillium hispanicum]KAJ5585524.1 hypothetical protein N7459_005324 [Penicillium hispanicum]